MNFLCVWCMVYGVWGMVYGVWCMVYGVWLSTPYTPPTGRSRGDAPTLPSPTGSASNPGISVCMVYGVCVWCMVYGAWCMVYVYGVVYGFVCVWCWVYGVGCVYGLWIVLGVRTLLLFVVVNTKHASPHAICSGGMVWIEVMDMKIDCLRCVAVLEMVITV